MPSASTSVPLIPGSPALSTTSTQLLPPHLPNHLRPSTIVTRKDQANSLAAYEGLLTASKAYTQALLALSSASNDFAFALQDCARLKGSHKVGPQLHAASGLEFLVASHSKLLADGFWKDFSIPLLEAFDSHRQAVAERQMAHDRVMAERSRELKECEEKELRGAAKKRGKERDLGSFRRALEELQRLVNGLDEERATHYMDVLAAEEEEWDRVSTRVSHLLRLQVEVHERLSSKPLSDPILEPMLSVIPDPFGAYSQPNNGASSSSSGGVGPSGSAGGEIFSVLQNPSDLLGRDAGAGGGSDDVLTPAGLLSPRAPATGLSRAPASSSASSTTKQHRDSTGSGGALSPRLGASNPPAPGEVSFAALGLTSASHPPSSGASGIGSPLFGSEDGSEHGDRADDMAGEDADPTTPTRKPSSSSATLDQSRAGASFVAGGAGLGRRLRKALSIIDDEEKGRRRQSTGGESAVEAATEALQEGEADVSGERSEEKHGREE